MGNKIYLNTRYENGIFIELLDILKSMPSGDSFDWGVLPGYDFMGIRGGAQKISIDLKNQIETKKIAQISWKQLLLLSGGVGQFIDLILLGCKDPINLKPYKDDNEMFEKCDIVIIMFDTSWWEVSCKDQLLLDRFKSKFKFDLKEVKD